MNEDEFQRIISKYGKIFIDFSPDIKKIKELFYKCTHDIVIGKYLRFVFPILNVKVTVLSDGKIINNEFVKEINKVFHDFTEIYYGYYNPLRIYGCPLGMGYQRIPDCFSKNLDILVHACFKYFPPKDYSDFQKLTPFQKRFIELLKELIELSKVLPWIEHSIGYTLDKNFNPFTFCPPDIEILKRDSYTSPEIPNNEIYYVDLRIRLDKLNSKASIRKILSNQVKAIRTITEENRRNLRKKKNLIALYAWEKNYKPKRKSYLQFANNILEREKPGWVPYEKRLKHEFRDKKSINRAKNTIKNAKKYLAEFYKLPEEERFKYLSSEGIWIPYVFLSDFYTNRKKYKTLKLV